MMTPLLKMAASAGRALVPFFLIYVTAALSYALLKFLGLSRRLRPIFIGVAFVVVGIGAYAASFVTDMIAQAVLGQLPSANIVWPCITWSLIALCSLVICAQRPVPFLARTLPFWILGGMALVASLAHSWNLITAIALILGGFIYGFFAGQRGRTNSSSKSRESAEPCFSIGQYSIDTTIDELHDLTPLSHEEIVALNPGARFDGEEIWHSPGAQFMGLRWDTILATVNRAIYKISIQWTGPRHQAGTACREITIYCTKNYGRQKDVDFQGSDLTVWHASDGNITLQMVNVGPESLLTVTVTSRKISQVQCI
jgi:hypothetical protein